MKRAKIAKAMELQKKADEKPALTPEVKWAQNPDAISLTISLSQILKEKIDQFRLKFIWAETVTFLHFSPPSRTLHQVSLTNKRVNIQIKQNKAFL